MIRATIALTGMMVITASAQALLVWESTFDAGADGVVDVVDGNLDKALIGPAGGGTVQINTMDRSGAFNDNDRGGRALGSTVDGNDSFSALYRYSYSDLNQDTDQMWEAVGFIGNDANTTRQKIGVMMRHWAPGGNNFTSLDLIYGEAGFGGFVFDASGVGGYGPLGPTAIFLGGASAIGRDLQLAIGYDGSTHVLTAELWDDQNNLISGNSRDLDDLLVPTNPNTNQTMLDALQMTHLGWSEYSAVGGDRTTTWEVDSLGYYDDAAGAFDAIPEPTVAMLMLGGLGLTAFRRRG